MFKVLSNICLDFFGEDTILFCMIMQKLGIHQVKTLGTHMNHKITSNKCASYVFNGKTSPLRRFKAPYSPSAFTVLMSVRFSIEGLMLPRMCPWSPNGFTVLSNACCCLEGFLSILWSNVALRSWLWDK